MLKGFKQVLMSGNVIDLTVAVIIGVPVAMIIMGAFSAVVTAVVRDLLTPLIAAIGGKPDFSVINFTVNGSRFQIGDLINAVVSFILIAAVVYFFVLVPINAIMLRVRRVGAEDSTTKQCTECLSTIPIHARRCAFCTSPVNPAETASFIGGDS